MTQSPPLLLNSTPFILQPPPLSSSPVPSLIFQCFYPPLLSSSVLITHEQSSPCRPHPCSPTPFIPHLLYPLMFPFSVINLSFLYSPPSPPPRPTNQPTPLVPTSASFLLLLLLYLLFTSFSLSSIHLPPPIFTLHLFFPSFYLPPTITTTTTILFSSFPFPSCSLSLHITATLHFSSLPRSTTTVPSHDTGPSRSSPENKEQDLVWCEV